MKLFVAAMTIALCNLAFAGIPLGVYTGKDASGTACRIEVVKIYFANGTHHPLNERVEVSMSDETWALGHPSVISEQLSQVRFNHDELSQVLATPNGAKTLILKIDHSSEPHGPKEVVLINDNYKDAALTTKLVCTGLTL